MMKTRIVNGTMEALIAVFGVMVAGVCTAETMTGTPDAYLEYVEATGQQYINTGVNAETGLKVRADFAWGGSSANNNDWGLVGAKLSGGSDNAWRMLMIHMYNQKPYVGYGLGSRGNPGNATNFTRSVRCEVVADFSDASALEIYQNGAKTLTASNQTTYAAQGNVDLGINLYAFAYNEVSTAKGMCSATLYELKIMKKNGSGGFDVVRHYLPCLKNGRAALYDKANGKICFSDSGTDFVAGNVLPTPSELVEWIESLNAASGDGTGSYIIDTRVYAKSGIKSAVDCMIRSGFTTDQAILACRWDGSNTRFFLAYIYQSYFGYGYKTGYWPQNVPVQNNKDYRYLIESDLSVGHQSVKVNGTELHGDAHDNDFFSPRTTLSLFSLHTGNNDSYPARSNIRLFATKIWDGDEILRDFVPCVDSLGQAGLYDRVTERVFKSPTAYSFETQVGVCTNWLSATPGTRPDRRIDYIESNGTNDYIDVGVMAKDGVEMETVMEWVTVPTDGAFVGARTDTLTNDAEKVGVRFFPYHHWNDHGSGHRIGYNGQLPGNSGVATAGTKYRIKSHLDVGDQWYTVETFQNGNWSAPVRVERAYANPVDTGLPLYLFAINFDGVPRYPGQSRVYKLKFWEKQPNGSYKLTREFVPCMKDGKAMLWDRVSETFFRNRGRYLISGGGNERKWRENSMAIVIR